MGYTIVNAAPMFVPLGTDDKSIKPITPQPIPIPSHLPLFYLWTEKGPAKNEMGLIVKELCDGGKLMRLYGENTVNPKSKYYNHATKFATKIIGTGNTIMVQRLIPEDNDKLANVTIYVDYIKDKVKKYKRHEDGSIAYDTDGNPIEDSDSPIDGYRVKVYAVVDEHKVGQALGNKTMKTGYMTDSDGNPSTMVPVVEFVAAYEGQAYENTGFAFSLQSKDDVNEDVLASIKALPFELFVFEKQNGIPVIKKDLFGSTKEHFVFRKDVTDPVTNSSLELKDVIQNWYNTKNPELPLVYPDIKTPYVYYKNIDSILSKVLETEKPYIAADVKTVEGSIVNTTDWFDFIPDLEDKDQKYLLNVFNAFSTKRVKYFSVVYDNTAVTLPEGTKEVFFSNNLPFFLGNGTDGEITDENFEKLVRNEMNKYIDPNSEVMDLAVNVESVFYDSGFSIDTKKSLVNFITVRKDTFLVLSTREDKLGDKFNDLVTERAIAINLKARCQLAPESTFFGTPVARACIVAGNGLDKNDTTGHRWPLSLHIAVKAARMMGAGNGKWNPDYLFDKGEDNIIDDMVDIQPAFVPQGVKPALWSSGLIWPERYDIERYYIPAMQTVYENDTSVLNSFPVGMALTKITKVAAACHRKFTGVTRWTSEELIENVENYMNSELADTFAGIIKVVTKAMITDFDKERGYSWTTVVKLGANNMKTVNTFYIEAYRLEEMA